MRNASIYTVNLLGHHLVKFERTSDPRKAFQAAQTLSRAKIPHQIVVSEIRVGHDHMSLNELQARAEDACHGFRAKRGRPPKAMDLKYDNPTLTPAKRREYDARERKAGRKTRA